MQNDLIIRQALIDKFKQLQGADTLANMFVSDVIKVIKVTPGACEELDAYQAIGTVDQCREAVERMLPKKVIVQINDKDVRIGHVVFAKGTKAYICQCGNRVIRSWKHCAECGQRLDWSE